MTAPGDWRVLQSLRAVAATHTLPLEVRDDIHFFSTVRDFAEFAKGRKQLRLEYWYRPLRLKHNILMDGKEPVGGQWNFESDNRESFGKAGPQNVPAPTRFEPDAPSFACSCSRERVGNMLRGLGVAEIDSILAERGDVNVGCEFCGAQYDFDPVDAAHLFTDQGSQLPPASTVQ